MELIPILPVLLLVAKCWSSRTNEVSFSDLMAEFGVGNDIPSSKAVITNKKYLYVGDTLQLYCTLPPKLTNQSYSASYIRFKKTYPLKEFGSKDLCIDPGNIVVHNQSTAEQVLRNVTDQEVVEYQCVLDPCDESVMPNNELVGSSWDIKVQYKPHNVTNFTCILYNWNEYMNCTWQHPVQYIIRYNDTRVTCSYNTDGSMNKAKPCPNQTFNGCWWNNIIQSLTHTIQINVTNTRTNDTSSTTFHVEPLNEVKPAAPKKIKVHALEEEDCFNITWQYHETQHSKKFNIFHQGPGDADLKIIASGLQEMFWKICGLKPYTFHNFSVTCLSKYPSDPSSLTYTTPQKVPLSGPEAVNGSYTTEECDTKSNQRKITLFWKDVKEADRNGMINQYIVSYTKLTKSVEKGIYLRTVTIPCSSHGETIKLFAQNDAGVSVNPTILSIAPYHFKVPLDVKESFSIEIVNNSLARAVWQHRSQNESANFMVFWRKENSQAYISWKPVPKDQSYIIISITDPLNYDFGLAMSGVNFSWTSPIEWANCFYELIPTSPPDSVEINVIPDEESAVITWENIKCSKVNRFKITSYYILYCPEDKCKSSADVQMISVSATESYHKLSNLTAKTSYNLTINIESFGVVRAWSNWKQFSTKAKSDGTDIIMLIILIPTLTVLFIIGFIVLIIICKRGRQRIKTLARNTEETVGITQEKINEVSGSANGTNISTRPNIGVNEPLISNVVGSDYCEESSLPCDSSSLLLNPSVKKSQSNGKTSIPMTDFSQLSALPDSTEDYSAITIIDEPGELHKETASGIHNVTGAKDKINQVAETQLTPSDSATNTDNVIEVESPRCETGIAC